jgi:hypothetical protein
MICHRSLMIFVATLLSACAEIPRNMPLVFGETLTFGASISGSTTDQGVEVTIGFKSRDIALVPVAIERRDGTIDKLSAGISAGNTDAFSVLGQFDSKTAAGTSAEVGLGRFFATGSAAQVLAAGFRCKLGDCRTASATGQGDGAAGGGSGKPQPKP